MNRLALVVAAAVLPVVLVAADQQKDSSSKASRREEFHRKLGGMLEKPDSMKGRAVVYNAQKTIAATNIATVAKRLTRQMMYNFETKEGTLDVAKANWKQIVESEKAAAVVFVVEDASIPSLLLAPDEHWAVVNVSKQGDGLMSEEAKTKFVPGRVTRQIYRAFALLGGSGRPGNQSPSTIRTLNDLDSAREALPMETMQMIGYMLEGRGMTKKVITTYRSACMQGWAPAPTNDAQKAIWDKAHEIPTKPIKIEFDPKTDKK